jgi:hypothetical protein
VVLEDFDRSMIAFVYGTLTLFGWPFQAAFH